MDKGRNVGLGHNFLSVNISSDVTAAYLHFCTTDSFDDVLQMVACVCRTVLSNKQTEHK